MAAALFDTEYSRIVALIIFIAAGITDHIDGYVARRFNQITTFGKFIDPLADKVLVISALLILVEWGRIPSWCAMIIVAREFAVSGFRLVAASAGTVIAAGFSGKIKTLVSIVAICFMLTDGVHNFELGFSWLTVDNLAIFLMVFTTVWSGVDYFWHNRKLLNGRK
jgi:CDP-diacylglycerol--glycerol-3-phosphate 3-phosphatidyltransferase